MLIRGELTFFVVFMMPGYDDGNYISQNNQHHNKIRSTATKTRKLPETNKMLALELMKFSYGAEKKIRQ